MPTFMDNRKFIVLFIFNHIITRFEVLQAIITDYGLHFHNHMMAELSTKLGFFHETSSPYYPQENGQVEAINNVLKTMIQWMVGAHK